MKTKSKACGKLNAMPLCYLIRYSKLGGCDVA